MNATNNYPEIAGGTVRDTRGALSMAYNNYDSLTEAGKVDLVPRIRAMHARLAELGNPVPVPADMQHVVFADVFMTVNGMNAESVAVMVEVVDACGDDGAGLVMACRVALKERARRLKATAGFISTGRWPNE